MSTDRDALPSIFRAGNNVITDAYSLGIEAGRREGYEEQARDHHQWLLNTDERMAQVAEDAARFALLDAAEAWDVAPRDDPLIKQAEAEYGAGGPSMPTIWLRIRAANLPPTTAPAPSADSLDGGA